eukprot:23243-Eustigmatos_ZCMA.PRE.1
MAEAATLVHLVRGGTTIVQAQRQLTNNNSMDISIMDTRNKTQEAIGFAAYVTKHYNKKMKKDMD